MVFPFQFWCIWRVAFLETLRSVEEGTYPFSSVHTSLEQLASGVKGIYAGPVMAEGRSFALFLLCSQQAFSLQVSLKGHQ